MPNRTRLIAGNWKMNLEEWEAVELAGSIADGLPDGTADVVVCPPFPWLVPVAAVLEGSRVALGAQDCSAEVSGAYTGQVSATMLNGLCRYVIAGHSEHRRDCCESNELVGRKARAALDAGIAPIVCVGEAIEVRDAGKAVAWVEEQVEAVIAAVGSDQLTGLIVAYEPIWAIGTGRSASEDDAEEIAAAIRRRLAHARPAAAESVRILYGGSANAANAGSYLAAPNIDGLLVGGACLTSDSFLDIIASAG
ncbi:MAG TPA: triose-phosphate isomerase [Thermomicrobiales bacterium]|nr:triose-phosphate isomerase [Thermomicrobiales bacterium]